MAIIDPETNMPIPALEEEQGTGIQNPEPIVPEPIELPPTVEEEEEAVIEQPLVQDPAEDPEEIVTLTPEQKIAQIIDNMSDDEVAYALEHGMFDTRVGVDKPEDEVASEELTSSFTASLMDSQPAKGGADPSMTNSLLDLIGDTEAPKGYNQINGRNQFAPLNEMTINEVYQLQHKMQNSTTSESSAVGRYQIINKTLKDLVKTMGLTGEEKFTPELQDAMATQLLKKRGLDAYLAGNLTPEQFGNNLSKEWASFPIVQGNRAGYSYYAGVGSNKALISPEEVLASLDILREQGVTPPRVGEQDRLLMETGMEAERLSPVTEGGRPVYTAEGRPMYENQAGDLVTERTITENINGKWYNIPTVYDGELVDPMEAVERVVQTERNGELFDPITGRELQPFPDVDTAVKSAEERSPTLDQPGIIRAVPPVEKPQFMQNEEEDTGTITANIVTEPDKAWENTFNFAQNIGLSRTASQKLAGLAGFIAGFSPSAPADVVATGTKKISKGQTAEGVTDIATELVPIVGDVGLSLFAGIKKASGRGPGFIKAAKSLLAGDTPETIRKNTGWFRGRDKKWRFELDDSKSNIIAKTRSNMFSKNQVYDLPFQHEKKGVPLSEVLDHKKLFMEYPQLKDYEVFSTPPMAWDLNGAYSSETKRIYLNPTLDQTTFKSTLLHELQHAIQDVEGFISGASPTAFLPNGFDTISPRIMKKVQKTYDGVRDKVNLFAVKRAIQNIKNGGELGSFEREQLHILKETGKMDEVIEAMEAESLISGLRYSADQKYRAVAGEVEARNVQERMFMSAEERKDLSPWFTEDTPPSHQRKSPYDIGKE